MTESVLLWWMWCLISPLMPPVPGARSNSGNTGGRGPAASEMGGWEGGDTKEISGSVYRPRIPRTSSPAQTPQPDLTPNAPADMDVDEDEAEHLAELIGEVTAEEEAAMDEELSVQEKEDQLMAEVETEVDEGMAASTKRAYKNWESSYKVCDFICSVNGVWSPTFGYKNYIVTAFRIVGYIKDHLQHRRVRNVSTNNPLKWPSIKQAVAALAGLSRRQRKDAGLPPLEPKATVGHNHFLK
ncbi:hypothetical protein BDK51DRAFT_31239 [Blyttiomyces helicus]|uniref:Uncharacterized protein n=1 Tax=Blyttiomyces helicus TaxID=388810 RepID=A0A4P9WL98_9FUNG|nr:hypothetical protein BDK51DRAFT_31239 [Blyttiomyces helicus]|eukprot:RKO92935.1 hypothetical protein BDK51DRAFT_31239 [Blyttiomyces helicus]